MNKQPRMCIVNVGFHRSNLVNLVVFDKAFPLNT
jgi:hypothetical protein